MRTVLLIPRSPYSTPAVVARFASNFRLPSCIATTPYQEENMMSETGTYRDKRRENATELAISGLAFLAADPERLERFLSLTGLDPGSIRSAAQEPGFLGGVIRHIMEDDRIAAAFAA